MSPQKKHNPKAKRRKLFVPIIFMLSSYFFNIFLLPQPGSVSKKVSWLQFEQNMFSKGDV